jgi:dolichol-phosphate mannosyltransferase
LPREIDEKTDSSDVVESAPTGALAVPALAAGAGRLQLSLIVPTYNESENVRNLVATLTELLDARFGSDYEIIIVDDDSADKTWQIAAQLVPEYPRLRVVRRQNERGLSGAVIRGWQLARGGVLGVIDGDLQHPPELLVTLWDKMSGGADLAVASRHVEGGGVSDWSIRRRILSRGAQAIGLALLYSVVSRVSDPMSGYFMVRREAIAGIPLNPLGYKILLEVLGRGTIQRVAEAGYVFRERAEGKSKITWALYGEFVRHLLRLRA